MKSKFPLLPLFLSCLLLFPLLGFGQEVIPPPPPPPSVTDCFTPFTERMPLFPGCETVSDYSERKRCSEKKLMEYVYANIEYPQAAQDRNVAGTAVVTFVVRKDGAITDVDVVRDPGAGTGDAAAEVVGKMIRDGIKWTPASSRGRVVNVQYNLPVKFVLADDSPINLPESATEQKSTSRPTPQAPPPPPPPYPIVCSELFKVVEEMPRYYDADCEACTDTQDRDACAQAAMTTFIQQNLRYPPESCVEGTCVVAFVVEEDGTLTDIRVVRDIGAGCGAEAIRVVKLMSEHGWLPGWQGAHKVRVLYNLPIRFQLE